MTFITGALTLGLHILQAALGPRHPVVGAACRALAELTLASGARDAASLRTATRWASRAVDIAEAAWADARHAGAAHKGWWEGTCISGYVWKRNPTMKAV